MECKYPLEIEKGKVMNFSSEPKGEWNSTDTLVLAIRLILEFWPQEL